MKLIYDGRFDKLPGSDRSRVFQVFPDVFKDDRGYFAEVMKERDGSGDEIPQWFRSPGWIKQINRSKSAGGVVRGCHAQSGASCQGKLVQALTAKIYDVITDARPQSATFRRTEVYVLDPEIQNQLWVPRGFLHAFAVPAGSNDAIFEYFCDNIYDHQAEFGCRPLQILSEAAAKLTANGVSDEFKDYVDLFQVENGLVLSPKDQTGLDFKTWSDAIQTDLQARGLVWFEPDLT